MLYFFTGSEVQDRLQLLEILLHYYIMSGTAYKGGCFMVTIIGVLCSLLPENHLNIDPWGTIARN